MAGIGCDTTFCTAYNGHLSIVDYYVKKLESQGKEINPALTNGTSLGMTPLLLAAVNGYLDIVDYYVKKLESQGKHINPALTTGPSVGLTPLHIATFNRHLHIVEYYVKKLGNQGRDINPAMTDGNEEYLGLTPLYIAARGFAITDKIIQREIVEYYVSELESQGKDINPAVTGGEDMGWTPLHKAASNGCLDIVDYYVNKLESQGKDINPALTEGEYLGCTPLHIAASYGGCNIVDYYVKKLESQGKEINPSADGVSHGWTPLHIAVSKGRLDIVDYYVNKLESQGKDINPVLQGLGWTPFHIAADKGWLDILNYYIKKLESQGKDINPALIAGPNLGSTPLHVAAANGCLAIVKTLIYRGALLMAKNNAGQTAEDLAREHDHQDVATYLHTTAPLTQQLVKVCNRTENLIAALVANYQKLFKTSQSEISTLYYLNESIKTFRGQVKKLLKHINQLIEQGAEVNAQGKKGYTPLHCLIGYYNPEGPTQLDEEIRTLIDSGAVDLDAVADNGDTALSLASQYGNSRIFKYLLKKGANPTIGINPFQVALQYNRPHILRYVLMGPEKQIVNYRIKRSHGTDEDEGPQAKKLRVDQQSK